ncbi:MAG: DNA polymerase Y family protein [Geminicoccaceae bacterium]|nr:DNA polymerase Y family protein [Geminicoccaceae bacterium]MDW8125106.1 DNA polymerase Y family protein [Geminicoccaceae bacterium]
MSPDWLCILLPRWPIQRLRLRARRRGEPWSETEPLALVAPAPGGPRLVAVNAAAEALRLVPGLPLADARAARPHLRVLPAAPEEDARALRALALRCTRWSPRVAVDGADALMLDVRGCAHLWGGAEGLLASVAAAFARLGLEHRAALAERRLAARLWARFGPGGILSDARDLDDLPVEALELEEETCAVLRRLGSRRIGDLRRLPRASLARRFGLALARALEILDGAEEPPFVPLGEPARFAARIARPEPIATRAGIAFACRRLVCELCRALESAGRGALRLVLELHRVDGETVRLALGTSRPSRDPEHLFRLLRYRLERLDLGFGVECAVLAAPKTVVLPAEQPEIGAPADARAAAVLIDRLAARLGAERVLRPEPVATHVPERAVRWCPAGVEPRPGPWVGSLSRPLRLFARPLPVRALALVPDGPPVRLEGAIAGRVIAASGPERVLPEWWRAEDASARPRDFFRIRLEDGRALWCAREGLFGEASAPAWSVLGSFS